MSTSTLDNATTVSDATSSPILGQLFPTYSGCTRSCQFTWNGTQYVLVGGDTCGGDCHCPKPLGNLKKLLVLEGKLKNYDTINLSCCAGGCNVLEPAIWGYIKLLIAYKLLLRIAAGLGLLGVVLAGIIVYLLAR
jgi:hypothetical protein